MSKPEITADAKMQPSRNPDRTTQMDLKTQGFQGKKSWSGGARGERLVAGAEARRIRGPFLTFFSLDFSRFEVYCSCSVRVLRRDAILASQLISDLLIVL